MKKIYSKFVKDRRKEFQIETALWDDNGSKCVSKRSLYEDGKGHIDHIIETYCLYSKSGLICKAQKYDDKVFFEYIDGKTFETMLLSAMKRKDQKSVENLIQQYNKIVDEICSVGKKKKIQDTEASKGVFGMLTTDVDGYSNVIFDLTFDNIIYDGQDYKVIDYEWRFDFCVEKEFIKFRAAYSFMMKFKGVVIDLYSIEEFYRLFGVKAENVSRYLEYNNNFVIYVYGKENYNDIIKKYEKMSMELFEEETMGTLKTLQKRKSANVKSYEEMFFDKLLDVVEKNRDYYDDYTKFFKVTKKIREFTPNGYTETPEFVEEFTAYIDDLYNLVEFYKSNLEQCKGSTNQRKLRSIFRRLTH